MTLIERLDRVAVDGPIVWAHRGCSSTAPENTLAAFEQVVAHGIEAVELDVHRCATGQIVVAHDDTLLRTAGVDVAIRATPYDELLRHDVGGWFAPEFCEQRVPLLSDVLGALGPDRFVDIEIKHYGNRIGRARPGDVESETVRIVREHGIERHVVVSSFDPFIVRRVGRIAPEILRAVIYIDSDAMPRWMRGGGGRPVARATIMKPHHEQLTAAIARRHHRRGRRVLAWTVDDAPTARALVQSGADGIITNRPVEIREALSTRAQRREE
ncbi:MAG: hypothetical protein EA382_03295 [Spirochaetaceae bacterium]|nr:MAG: hypothetical protein EA382_03295 [Spirochaetaceae bacterium]